MNANDDVVPIAELFYDSAGPRDYVVPIADLLYGDVGPRDDVVPIAGLFYDDAGPHIARAGAVPHASERKFTPVRGRELHSLLNTSIVQLGGVSGNAGRKTPTPATVVPVATLLYRGRAALERALELRREIREAGSMPQRETLAELLDLIALAATE